MKKTFAMYAAPLVTSAFLSEPASAAVMANPDLGAPHDRELQDYRWPGGIIPYRVDPQLHEWRLNAVDPNDRLTRDQLLAEQARTRQELEAAIADWESATEGLIDFVEIDSSQLSQYEKSVLVTDHEDWYCASPSGGGFHTTRGAYAGEHPVYLPPICSPATVKHEMGHVIGFLHQHQSLSYLRNEYIEFHESNMRYFGVAGKEDQHRDDMWNMRDLTNYWVAQVGPYDYKSIMHYGTHALAQSGAGPTLVPINPPWAVIGYEANGGVISQGDIDGVKVLYGRSEIKNTVRDRCVQVDPRHDDQFGGFFYIYHVRDPEDHSLYVSECTDEGYHEEWVLSPEGWLISANGRCVASNEITASMAYPVSRECDGSNVQKWTYDASTHYLKDYAGRCLWGGFDYISYHLQDNTGDSNAKYLFTVDCGSQSPSDMRWNFERVYY